MGFASAKDRFNHPGWFRNEQIRLGRDAQFFDEMVRLAAIPVKRTKLTPQMHDLLGIGKGRKYWELRQDGDNPQGPTRNMPGYEHAMAAQAHAKKLAHSSGFLYDSQTPDPQDSRSESSGPPPMNPANKWPINLPPPPPSPRHDYGDDRRIGAERSSAAASSTSPPDYSYRQSREDRDRDYDP